MLLKTAQSINNCMSKSTLKHQMRQLKSLKFNKNEEFHKEDWNKFKEIIESNLKRYRRSYIAENKEKEVINIDDNVLLKIPNIYN